MIGKDGSVVLTVTQPQNHVYRRLSTLSAIPGALLGLIWSIDTDLTRMAGHKTGANTGRELTTAMAKR